MRSPGTVGAAAVTDAATWRMVLSEVSPQEDAAAFRRLGVGGDEPEPALALETKGLELRHEIAGTTLEGIERHRDDDATLFIALDEAGLLEIGQQRLADPCRDTSRVR